MAATLLLVATTASAQVRVTGTTVDSTGAPISLVLVRLGDESLLTDSRGRFGISSRITDSAVVSFTRVGYRPHEVRVPNHDFDLGEVRLVAVPIELDQITVAALEPIMTQRGVRDFQTKKREGFSRHFFTAYDIERIRPFDLAQLASRIPGASRTITSDGGAVVQFRHRGQSCFATVIVDGMPTNEHNLDAFVTPERVGGMIFDPRSCTVSVWTKPFPVGESSPFELGMSAAALHGGENGGNGSYAGISLVTPLRRDAGTLRLHLDAFGRLSGDGSKWQALLNVTGRPFGFSSPLYAGMGAGISKRGNVLTSDSRESLSAHHTLLCGASTRLAGAILFVEIVVLDPLEPSRNALVPRIGARLPLGGSQ